MEPLYLDYLQQVEMMRENEERWGWYNAAVIEMGAVLTEETKSDAAKQAGLFRIGNGGGLKSGKVTKEVRLSKRPEGFYQKTN